MIPGKKEKRIRKAKGVLPKAGRLFYCDRLPFIFLRKSLLNLTIPRPDGQTPYRPAGARLGVPVWAPEANYPNQTLPTEKAI